MPPPSPASAQFGRIPTDAVTSGALSQLPRVAVLTYIALCVHVDPDWTARPSIRRLARIVGASDRHVRRSLRALVDAGLVAVDRRKGRPSMYTILPSGPSRTPDIQMSGLSAPPVANPGHPDVRTSGVTPDILERNPGHPDVRRTEEQKETNQQSSASAIRRSAAGGVAKEKDTHAESVRLLVEAGVGDRAAKRLAAATEPDVIAAAVEVAGRRRNVVNRPGLIVSLATDPPGDVLDLAQELAQERKRRRRRRRDAKRLADARRVVASIPPAEWPQVVERACSLIRGRWPTARPGPEFDKIGQDAQRLPPSLLTAAREAWERNGFEKKEVCSGR